MKVEIEIVTVSSARKQHKCAYCDGVIRAGNSYTKFMSRLDSERFPIAVNICSSHTTGLIPLSLILRR